MFADVLFWRALITVAADHCPLLETLTMCAIDVLLRVATDRDVAPIDAITVENTIETFPR